MSNHGTGIINRLHPESVLRSNSNDGHKLIHGTIGEWLDKFVAEDRFKQLFILHATGRYLDLHGRERGVLRNEDESDENYRKRILSERGMHNCISELRSAGVDFWDYINEIGSGSQRLYFKLTNHNFDLIKNHQVHFDIENIANGSVERISKKTDERGFCILDMAIPKDRSYRLKVTTERTNQYNECVLDFSTDYKYNYKENTIIFCNDSNVRRITDESNIVYDNKLHFKLTSSKGFMLTNQPVRISVNGVDYTRYTNDEGIASLNIRLLPKEYRVSYSFLGDDNFNACSGTINLLSSEEEDSRNNVFIDSGIVFDIDSSKLTSKNTYIDNKYLAHADSLLQEHMLGKFIIDGVLEWF